MEPWHYGADILVDAGLCTIAASAYTVIRKIRGQTWNSAFLRSFRDMGIFFVLFVSGTLFRMGQHNILAIPLVRILSAILAVVLWVLPMIWFLRLMRGIRKGYDAPAAEELLQLSESKWVVVSMVLAMTFTIIPILSH